MTSKLNVDRRQFLTAGAALAGGLHSGATPFLGTEKPDQTLRTDKNNSMFTLGKQKFNYPLAITMWDFSWLERRWPGAGYEDWDQALDDLKVRGYDAVRIDAYPHLVSVDPKKEWDLIPCWNQQVWGSPALNRVKVQPALNHFIASCAERGMKVGLSTWFRQDPDNNRMKIKTPVDLGKAWKSTLDTVKEAGLLEHLLYVDLNNEFPIQVWTPYLTKEIKRQSAEGKAWMTGALEIVRNAYPDLAYTFSFTTEYESWQKEEVSFLDFLELHLWMTHFSDFYQKVGYNYELFDSKGYENMQKNAERVYRENPKHWQSCLEKGVHVLADWSRASGKALMTTECWGVVDYKDWPLLNWDWVKELCELGVKTAAQTGRWIAMGTSNFCGPQFAGMWRDVRWHQRLTDLIHRSSYKL
jgi:hypothetical protein